MSKLWKSLGVVALGAVAGAAAAYATDKVIDKFSDGLEPDEDDTSEIEAASGLGDAGEDAEPDPAAFVPTETGEDTDRVEA